MKALLTRDISSAMKEPYKAAVEDCLIITMKGAHSCWMGYASFWKMAVMKQRVRDLNKNCWPSTMHVMLWQAYQRGCKIPDETCEVKGEAGGALWLLSVDSTAPHENAAFFISQDVGSLSLCQLHLCPLA